MTEKNIFDLALRNFQIILAASSVLIVLSNVCEGQKGNYLSENEIDCHSPIRKLLTNYLLANNNKSKKKLVFKETNSQLQNFGHYGQSCDCTSLKNSSETPRDEKEYSKFLQQGIITLFAATAFVFYGILSRWIKLMMIFIL